MRKLFTVLATAIVLLAGSALMKAEAAPMRGLGDLSPVTTGYSPVNPTAVWSDRQPSRSLHHHVRA
jgi:hypothetical protein